MRIALKPYLIYVPGQDGHNPHFRGGDDLIIPINRVDNAELMNALMEVLSASSAGVSEDDLWQHPKLGADKAQVKTLLGIMVDSGILWMPPTSGSRDFLWNYLSRFAPNMTAYEQRLNESTVSVRSHVSQDIETAINQSLELCGLSIGSDASPELTLVYADFVSDSNLDVIDEELHQAGRPWLLVRFAGPAQLQLGPVFIPGETACYGCLNRRMEANRRYFDAYQDFKQIDPLPAPQGSWHPVHISMAAQAVAFETVKYLLGVETSALVGGMRTIDFLSGESEDERLLKLPDCKRCGSAHAG